MCKMMSRFATIVIFCLFISSSPLINASVEGEEAAADLRYVYDTTPYQGAFALNSDLMALQNQINDPSSAVAAAAAAEAAVIKQPIEVESLKSTIAGLKLQLEVQSNSSASLNSTVVELQSKLEAQSNSSESAIAELRLQLEVRSNSSAALKSIVETLQSQFADQSNSSATSTIAELKSKLEEMQLQLSTKSGSTPVSPVKPVAGPMPTGCSDVQSLGWTQSGFYTVKSSAGTKVNTVYCDFSKENGATGYETIIGFNDVKTATGVYFYSQRKSDFTAGPNGAVIPYEEELLNIGGAMNMKTGVFTAPVNGRYYFSFTATSCATNPNERSLVSLRLNDASIGSSYSLGVNRDSLPIVATLSLKKDDKVDAHLMYGLMCDSVYHHTQFSGILLEEDLNLV